MQYSIILTGKVKPCVRMTKNGKWVDPAAIEYLASQTDLRYQIREQLRDWELPMLPAQSPLWVKIEMQAASGLHTKDSDNLIKALLDCGNKLIYPDDRWIDRVDFSRRLGEADVTILTVGTL